MSAEEPGRAEATQGFTSFFCQIFDHTFIFYGQLWKCVSLGCTCTFLKSLLLWTAVAVVVGMGGGSTANPASVSETFPCVPLMPPSRWHSSLVKQYMQVCLIRRHDYCTVVPWAAHNKRPLYIVLYWGGGWVSICLTNYNTSPVGPLSSSMAVWGCWILWGKGTRCCVCRSRASPTCSMSDTYGACWPCKNWDVFSFQELCDPARSWRGGMNGTTMGLRISLWYLCTFKMPSIKCTYVRCPYHNPTATMGHSIHKVDISKRLSSTTPCMLPSICPPSALYSETIHPWRKYPSKVPEATQVGYDDNP